jgi:hypothetical protein
LSVLKGSRWLSAYPALRTLGAPLSVLRVP